VFQNRPVQYSVQWQVCLFRIGFVGRRVCSHRTSGRGGSSLADELVQNRTHLQAGLLLEWDPVTGESPGSCLPRAGCYNKHFLFTFPIPFGIFLYTALVHHHFLSSSLFTVTHSIYVYINYINQKGSVSKIRNKCRAEPQRTPHTLQMTLKEQRD